MTTTDIIPVKDRSELGAVEIIRDVPLILEDAGKAACQRARDYFAVKIRNPNTRAAYGQGIGRFLSWCSEKGLRLEDIEAIHVAAYIERLQKDFSAPSVKQHLSAIKRFFQWMIVGGILKFNPANDVTAPKHVVRKGKTPVLSAEDMGILIRSIDTSTITGLRDRALIALMGYTFARVSAAVNLNVGDYYQSGKDSFVRLHEKGGVQNQVPMHKKAERYLDEYIEVVGIAGQKKAPLFRTCRGRSSTLLEKRMSRTDVLRMVYRRASKADINGHVCCHTFRGTGITTYLQNGGNLETAARIAGHASTSTTKLYDRRTDDIDYEEVSRIHF